MAAGCFSPCVDHAAASNGVWDGVVDRFPGETIGPGLGNRREPSIHGVGSFTSLDSPAFFLER